MNGIGVTDKFTCRQMNNCDTLKTSKELRAMRDMKLLEDHGKGSATYYKPGEKMIDAMQEYENTPVSGLNNQEQGLNNQEQGLNNQDIAKEKVLSKFPEKLRNRLCMLHKRENNEAILQELICDLCAVTPLSKEELALCLNRQANYLRHRFLGPMIDKELLRYSHPEVPTYRGQTYITNQPEEHHE